MFLAAKHFDPILGVDTHIILLPTPAGPVPTPIPAPFVGILFDPADYLPVIGTNVYINGLPRAHAGTAGKAMPPHVPMGGPFAQPPGNEAELYMGSSTVLVEDEPMGYAGLPVLSCQDIGVPAPLRLKKGTASKSLKLPTSIVMPIPSGTPVLIGGAPTISMPGPEALVAYGAKRFAKSVKKAKALKGPLARLERKMVGASDYLNGLADRVFKRFKMQKHTTLRNLVSRAICAVTGHPVDICTGKVFTDAVDLELGGPLSFKLERVWYSTSTYQGPLGYGWHASWDMALAEDREVVGVRLGDGRVALFPALGVPGAAPAPGQPERPSSFFNREERLTLHRDDWHARYRMMDAQSGLTYHFAQHQGREDMPLVAIEDRNGFKVEFHCDGRGKLHEIVDSGGRTWALRHDAETGQLYEVEGPDPDDPHKRRIYLQYLRDWNGDLVEVHDAYGQVQRFAYKGHLLVKETYRNGLSFYFEWDGKDDRARCVRTWGDGGIYDHKLTYDPIANITTVENSLGFKTQYEHDGAMVRRKFDAFGNVRETEYGRGHRVTADVDELGQRSEYAHDERGNLIKTILPDGSQITVEYDANDLPVRALDAVGGVWSWTRDEKGRVLKRKDPLGRSTRYQYDGRWLTGVVNPAEGRTSLRYDRMGNVDKITTPDGAITRYGYDLLGRVIASADPKGNVQRRKLDLLGLVQQIEEPDGNVRTFLHDAEGNVVRARDKQHDVRFTYQGMNRLASRTEAGTTVKFRYDTEEQLTGIVNEHGYAYRFMLGPTGEVVEEHGFDGLTRKYTRDKRGRVTRVDRPGERFSEYTHDRMGRVTEVAHSDGCKESYRYRADGALLSAKNDAASVTFERDLLGRIVKESQGDHAVESEYDLLGMRAMMKSSLGARQEITRNRMGDVATIAALGTGDFRGAFGATFTRDELGLELERDLAGGPRSTWKRDELGRPTQHLVTAGDTTLRAVGYRWEVNDRLTTLLDGLRGPTEFSHDVFGNLAGAIYPDRTRELRMPDAVGNLFRREDRKDRVYGRAGQLLGQSTLHGEIHYAYDPEGNLIERREPNGATWRYAWNDAGMLAKATRPDGDEVTFTYDALGRRTAKTYRGQITRWIWDGNLPLHEWVEGALGPAAEVDGVPLLNARPEAKRRDAELEALLALDPGERGTDKRPITWVFEPESFAPMAKLYGDRAFLILCDQLGTPALMTEASGKLVWSAGTSVYGELRNLDGQRHACPFRWPGQYEDLETGLYYNRFRYYDPEAGEFVSQDLIGLAGGLALYGYVHDPLTWVDPFGLAPTGTTGVSALSDLELYHETHDLMYRDKRAPQNRRQGTHGLVHRYKEQIRGAMRPGSRGWDTHEHQMHNQQKALRLRLYEMEKRNIEPPNNAWKIATTKPPSGNQRCVPAHMK